MRNKIILVLFFLLHFISYCFSFEDSNQYLVIINSNIKLYSDSNTGAPLINISENLFGRAFDIIEQDGRFIEIKLPNGKNAYLLNHKDDVIVSSYNQDYIYAEKNPSSNLTKKVLVVNKIEKKEINTQINIYDNPELRGNPVGRISIFEIRYLFREDNDVVFVGRQDRLLKENADLILIGWIDKNFTILWNNRIGIEFDKDPSIFEKRYSCEKGTIYHSERALKRKSEPIFTESSDSIGLPFYANRYPLLKTTRNRKAYKIAYIGNAFGNKRTYSAQDIDAAKHSLEKIINSNDVEIAILIDATKGMKRHISNVKKALNNFLSENKRGLQAKLTIAVYRDYPDGDNIFETLGKFTSNYNSLKNFISSIKVYSDVNDRGVGAYPEAVFYGIYHTVNDLNWSSGKKEKYIILIGDHGNHKNSKQYPQDRQFTPQKIGKLLSEKAFTLNLVQVNITDNKRKYNKMLENQFKIIKENNSNFGEMMKVYENSSDAIERALYGVFNNHQIIVNELTKVRLNDYKGVYNQVLLERYGIDPNIFQATQICSKGYVSIKNKCGDTQVIEKVLMTRKEIESLRTQMTSLADAVFHYSRETEDDLRETIFKVVKALTGDKITEDESISDFIEKKSGIPIRTEMLDKSIDDFIRFLRNKKENRRKFRMYILEKMIGLDEVAYEKDIEVKGWDQEDWSFITNKTEIDIPYFFSLEMPIEDRGDLTDKTESSKKRHAWVPMEYLP